MQRSTISPLPLTKVGTGGKIHFFSCARKKNGFVRATKFGTTNKVFVAATKNFDAATKRFVDRITKPFVVVTKYFCYPYFNK